MDAERDDARILSDALRGRDGDLVALHIARKGGLLGTRPMPAGLDGQYLQMEVHAQWAQAIFAKQLLDDLGFTMRVGRKPMTKETED